MPEIADIADAIVAELAGGSWSQSFTPERTYLPTFELADSALHVTAVPRGTDEKQAARDRVQYDHKIDVAIQQKLAAVSNAAVDALLDLAQEIREYLGPTQQLADYPSASWVGASNAQLYSPDHLRDWRQFTTVITLTYRIVR